MHRLLRCAPSLFIALSWAATAIASVPSPSNSIIPSHIRLGIVGGGTPDPAGAFTVTVRDLASVPVPNSSVVIDLSGCPDLFLGLEASPGVTVDCLTKTARAFTDGAGIASFVLSGHALNRNGLTAPCGVIYADGVNLGPVAVAAYDLDGVNGLGAGDLHMWFCDFFSNLNPQRADYNNNLGVESTDLSLLIERFVAFAKVGESATHCDATPNVTPLVTAGALNLAWNDCAAAGAPTTKTFACNTNTGPSEALVGSIVAPGGATSVVGFEAIVRFQSDNGGSMPPWWGFAGGQCRSVGAFSATTVFSGSACLDPWDGGGTNIVVAPMIYGEGGPNHGRVCVMGATAFGVDLSAGAQYSLFQINISHVKTTGGGACLGCIEPVCLSLDEIYLRRIDPCTMPPTLNDFHTIAPAQNNVVLWQGQPNGCTGPTAIKNVTWGRIKSIYR